MVSVTSEFVSKHTTAITLAAPIATVTMPLGSAHGVVYEATETGVPDVML